jgi:Leucine Rich repeats (2 copies)
MNVIEQKREEVQTTNNTAQSNLERILKSLDTSSTSELHLDIPLHGDLDFSILKDRGYKVKQIFLEKEGQITALRNIPEGVTHLDCQNQLLLDVDLPTTLEFINLSHNHITKFDAKNLPKLEVLHISNNSLTTLVNLPSTLKEMECENNDLKRLNLSTCPNLKRLHCSQNPLLMLEHVPASLEDLEMDNDIVVEPNTMTKKKSDQKFHYLESIQEFFRLKNEYETKLLQAKRNAFEKAGKGKAGKKKVREVQGKCVVCKRPVGSVFRVSENKYSAHCGDIAKPCGLNIQIYNSDIFDFEEIFDTYSVDTPMQDLKQSMIQQKMDTLFGYVAEKYAVEDFKKKLAEYESMSEFYKDMFDKYNSVYNNAEHKVNLSRKMQEQYRLQEVVQKMTDEYLKTGVRETLHQAMSVYVNELLPVIHSIRTMKYAIHHVETDEKYGLHTDVSTLIQYEVSPFERDFIYGEPSHVQKFHT